MTLRVLQDVRCVDLLTRYYDPDGNYAGASFDERRPPATSVTPDDLLAVTTLSVSIGPRAQRLLRAGERRSEIEQVLARLSDVPLASADDELIDRGVALHRLIKSTLSAGNQWVTASKITARLRPSLAPVRDSVVVAGLGLANKDITRDWVSIRHVVQQPTSSTTSHVPGRISWRPARTSSTFLICGSWTRPSGCRGRAEQLLIDARATPPLGSPQSESWTFSGLARGRRAVGPPRSALGW